MGPTDNQSDGAGSADGDADGDGVAEEDEQLTTNTQARWKWAGTILASLTYLSVLGVWVWGVTTNAESLPTNISAVVLMAFSLYTVWVVGEKTVKTYNDFRGGQ